MVDVVHSGSELDTLLSQHGSLVVAYFWADFHEACKEGGQMDQVLKLLAGKFGGAGVKFVKIAAEELAEVAEKYGVSMVPSFVFLYKGKKIDLVEGSHPPTIQSAVEKNLEKARTMGNGSSDTDALNNRLKRLTESAPVVLFMKGTGAEPKCKFSRGMVELLNDQGITNFATVDVLKDDEIRQGMKAFSKWDTFPQLYINGSFVGGLDKTKELAAAGSLKELLSKKIDADKRNQILRPVVIQSNNEAHVDDAYLTKLVRSAPVMLFMKGTPSEPRCGFSRQMVQILQENNVPFASFDILTNEDVRQKLKTFSNWPTYPQLYNNGTLVGGLDIVKELVEEEELLETLSIPPQAPVVDDNYLKQLINKAPVMLFMKGSPKEPRCGFSRQMVQILQSNNVQFETFDILSNEDVRQKLKTFSKWPTYPQLYKSGTLIGGLDIVKELVEEDELASTLA